MRISQYVSTGEPPRGPDRPMRSGALPMGQALARAGQVAARIAADVPGRQKALQDRIAVTHGLAALQAAATADMLAAQRDAPPGAPAFTASVLMAYDRRNAAQAEALPSEEARAVFAERAAAHRASLRDEALAFEARSAGEARIAAIESALALSSETVLAAPGRYDELRAEMLAGIDALAGVLPAQPLAAFRAAADGQLAHARLRGLIRRDPAAALADLDQGRMAGWLPPADQATLRILAETAAGRRETEARQRQVEADADYMRGLDDAVAALEAGGTALDPRYGAEALIGRFGAERGGALARRVAQAASAGRIVAAVNGATPDELAAMPATEPGDAAALRQAIAARERALTEDPALFVLRHAPGVRAAYDAMEAIARDPAGDPTALATATRRYAVAVRAEQERLGVRPEGLRVLPAADAEAVAARFMTRDGEDAATVMRRLSDRWDAAWPAVFAQLADDLPPAALAIGSGMRDAAAGLLAEAARIGRDGMLKTLPPTAEADLEEALAPFGETLASQGGGAGRAFADAAALLALRYMGGGLDAATAARRAVRDILGRGGSDRDDRGRP